MALNLPRHTGGMLSVRNSGKAASRDDGFLAGLAVQTGVTRLPRGNPE